jgi:hypothetical protein
LLTEKMKKGGLHDPKLSFSLLLSQFGDWLLLFSPMHTMVKKNSTSDSSMFFFFFSRFKEIVYSIHSTW